MHCCSAVDDWLSRPYLRRVERLPDGYGGGYLARVPQFAAQGVSAVGPTPAAAVAALDATLRAWFEALAERGEVPPPAEAEPPVPETDGQLVVHLPEALQQELVSRARSHAVCVNGYLVRLVTAALSAEATVEELLQALHGRQAAPARPHLVS